MRSCPSFQIKIEEKFNVTVFTAFHMALYWPLVFTNCIYHCSWPKLNGGKDSAVIPACAQNEEVNQNWHFWEKVLLLKIIVEKLIEFDFDSFHQTGSDKRITIVSYSYTSSFLYV